MPMIFIFWGFCTGSDQQISTLVFGSLTSQSEAFSPLKIAHVFCAHLFLSITTYTPPLRAGGHSYSFFFIISAIG